jgi:hypothetical protein
VEDYPQPNNGERIMTIAELKNINQYMKRWFSKDAMRFFNTKIITTGDLYKDRFFITSEHTSTEPKCLYYSVREVVGNSDDELQIKTHGDSITRFKSVDQARAEMHELGANL